MVKIPVLTMRMVRVMMKAYVHLLMEGDDGCSVMTMFSFIDWGRIVKLIKVCWGWLKVLCCIK